MTKTTTTTDLTDPTIDETLRQYLERIDALEARLDRIEAFAVELAELYGIDITTLPSWAVTA